MIDDLLTLLEGVRDLGNGRYAARCPAHDDKTPSLSIRDAGDKILIFCHAGCHREDILTAIGMDFRDLYRDPWVASKHAAFASTGHEINKRTKFDPLDHERLIVEFACADLAAGKSLSMEDRARVQLAMDRLGIKEAS